MVGHLALNRRFWFGDALGKSKNETANQRQLEKLSGNALSKQQNNTASLAATMTRTTVSSSSNWEDSMSIKMSEKACLG